MSQTDDLRRIFIENGIESMEAVQELETAQDLEKWRWLTGAIPQHQYALAMLFELLKNPYLSQAVRILRGLDYVFEPPPELIAAPLTRIRCIVTELRNRMEFYVTQRESRVRNGMNESPDVPDLDQLDSSTCSSSIRNSVTPRDVSPIPRRSDSHDEHWSRTNSNNCCVTFRRRSEVSRLKEASEAPADPKPSHSESDVLQRQLQDIDTVRNIPQKVC